MRCRLLLALSVMLASCGPRTATTGETLEKVVGAPQPIADPVGIRPIPPIPAGMHGCWYTPAPTDPDEPGAEHRMYVTAETIQLEFDRVKQGVAHAEFVTRVSPSIIEGRFVAPGLDGHGPSTVATSLRLGDGGDWGPLHTLRRAEGDAGSDYYTRCTP